MKDISGVLIIIGFLVAMVFLTGCLGGIHKPLCLVNCGDKYYNDND